MSGASPPRLADLLAAEAAYAAFNSRRLLRAADGALEHRTFGQVHAVRDRRRPEPYFHRVIAPVDPDPTDLEAAIAWVRAAGAPPAHTTFHRHGTPPADADVFQILPTHALPPHQPDPRIRRASPADLDALVDLWSMGGDPVSAEVRALRGPAQFEPCFSIWLLRHDHQDVAMASSFHHGPFAWFGNANTQPSHRNQGLHTALLHARLLHAAAHGIPYALIDTHSDGPSRRNAARAGFEPFAWSCTAPA